ncbi:hypothetical protein ACFQHV_18455 [Promicromonospora thailandica]|uniref:Uncharacterized protein n=1 Tax=Promicromonospora thailandica TaxID=765201 RepID=A0A9X2G448_9MICO|nr:hypothetical protein [Promicromonospora thailandica]MCP2265183.1 hypothetical protein [Promicromonospora thailandica]BFF19740.1 hypothetical protein GCM10025730_32610 [Promicromonospora thailandica]
MTETAKFYTKARRIPMLVGKLPSGGRIWGGPYTITQVGAGAVVAFTLWQTAPLWARLGGFMNIVVAVGLVVGTVWATGKLPSSGRNPVAFVMDAMNLTSSPGRLVGGQVALPKPRLMTHRVMVVVPTSGAAPARYAEPVVRPAPAPVAAPLAPVPTELLPELTARGPADATVEGRRLDPRTDPQPTARPAPRPGQRSPADWAAAAAAAAAERRRTELTGVGELLAGRAGDTAHDDRTDQPTPRED